MRTGRTRCSRWPTAVRRRSATRSSTGSPPPTTCTARTAPFSTRRPSTRRSGFTTSPGTTRTGRASTPVPDSSARLYERALELMPGGVNSPVRAMRSIGREHPIFIDRGEGAELIDVDGNRYADFVCSWGPLILGHAHPEVVEAVREAAGRGTSYGAPTAGEVELAGEVAGRFESVEMIRMVNSGTEATMSAV